jgi:hypothetical protein
MISARDGWAVGDIQPKASGLTYPLIEHWDGVRWTLAPSPHVNNGIDGGLSGVTAVSTRDAWAVGGTLIEHWDGRRWRVVQNPAAIPRPGLADGTLNSVAALSSHDV